MMLLARLWGQGILSGGGIDSGFDRTTHWSGSDVWCLAIGFGLQMSSRFRRLFAFDNWCGKGSRYSPFPKTSIVLLRSAESIDFGPRWHMSLSFWIRDYVFIPLATMRRGILVEKFRSSPLHGPVRGVDPPAVALLFLVWGTYHGRAAGAASPGAATTTRTCMMESESRLWRTSSSWFVSISLISFGWTVISQQFAQARQMLSAALSPTSYSTHFLSPSLYGLRCTR